MLVVLGVLVLVDLGVSLKRSNNFGKKWKKQNGKEGKKK